MTGVQFLSKLSPPLLKPSLSRFISTSLFPQATLGNDCSIHFKTGQESSKRVKTGQDSSIRVMTAQCISRLFKKRQSKSRRIYANYFRSIRSKRFYTGQKGFILVKTGQDIFWLINAQRSVNSYLSSCGMISGQNNKVKGEQTPPHICNPPLDIAVT